MFKVGDVVKWKGSDFVGEVTRIEQSGAHYVEHLLRPKHVFKESDLEHAVPENLKDREKIKPREK